jgi:glutamate:Na+ symporter, ESS family
MGVITVHRGKKMTTPFEFAGFLAFGTMSIFLLVGVLCRARIPFLQRFLIPSCLIAGFLGLILLNAGAIAVPVKDLQTIAYHFFNISFISVGFMAFTGSDPSSGQTDLRPGAKAIARGALWGALIEGVTLPVQALIGCIIVLLFGAFGHHLFPTFGLFAPLGFTEGPGQALSIGKVWEGLGFEHAATIGLTFAALGFVFAFFVGVPLVNWGIRKTRVENTGASLPTAVLTGVVTDPAERESAGRLSMHSANIDAMAFQTALIGLVYILTYGFTILLSSLMDPTSAQTLWGFFFFFGMFIAMLIGWLMKKVGINHLIDPGVQKRITGWAIDFLIIATIMAIQPAIVIQYLFPIALIAILSGLATFAILVYFGKRTDAHNLERMAVMYGTCTGTVSSGLLLLRISDPNFKSPVAIEVGVMNIMAAPVVTISMVLVNAHFYWGWGIGWVMACFALILMINLLLLRVSKHWGPAKF